MGSHPPNPERSDDFLAGALTLHSHTPMSSDTSTEETYLITDKGLIQSNDKREYGCEILCCCNGRLSSLSHLFLYSLSAGCGVDSSIVYTLDSSIGTLSS